MIFTFPFQPKPFHDYGICQGTSCCYPPFTFSAPAWNGVVERWKTSGTQGNCWKGQCLDAKAARASQGENAEEAAPFFMHHLPQVPGEPEDGKLPSLGVPGCRRQQPEAQPCAIHTRTSHPNPLCCSASPAVARPACSLPGPVPLTKPPLPASATS